MSARHLTVILAIIGGVLLPSGALAQDTTSGSILGVVRDVSGGVLPGVAVEVASPALIEKVRAATTDDQGRYRVVDLRSGAYSVTFTLSGFVTLRREGIEVTTGFAATVDGEMKIGAVAETVTVSGAAPIVDVSNITQQTVLSREIVEALPIGKNTGSLVAVIPGATTAAANIDVGGTRNEQSQNFTIHGGGTMVQLRDGLFLGLPLGGQNHSMSAMSPTSTHETSLQITGGLGAEAQGSGVQLNFVPRDGGNQFHGSFVADFGSDALQASNLDTDLENRGLTTASEIRDLYDINGGFGGPIKRDQAWFFTSARRLENSSFVPGNYYNRPDLIGSLFYVQDQANPAYVWSYNRETATRATLRVSEKDRVTGTYLLQESCNCYDQIALGARAPDGTSNRRVWPLNMLQLGWTRVQNSRLLVEGRFGLIDGRVTQSRDHIAPNAIPILDQSRNYQYSAPANAINIGTQDFGSYQGYASASYVTGTHNLKFGMQLRKMSVVNDVSLDVGDGVGYVFSGSAPGAARPVLLSYFVVPYRDESFNQQHALYAQDQWVIRRVTLNLGFRFEYFKAYYPAQDQPAGPFVPARSFAAVDNAARLTDLNPRLGLAWNVFGDGRTAIKVATGRFQPVQAISNAITAQLNPLQALSTSATRNWTDDGDYIPEEVELGPLSNSNFGKPVVSQTWDRDVTHGFGNLPYSWQSSVTLSHELRSGLAVNVGYYRTTNGNFTVTDNALRGVGDYDTFCLTAPTHADLPGGGGFPICGIQDVKPAKVSAVQNVVKQASVFGDWSSVYNGVDITANARFAGGFLTGGVSIGKTTTDNCDVVAALPESGAAPQQACRSNPPWMSGTDFKVSFGHELPWQFRGTVNYQNTPGIATTASWNAPNSVIAPVLGRNLSACPPTGNCTATLTVPLVPNNSLYLEDRITLLNFAVSRDFNIRGVTVRPRFQLDNSLNVNPVITVNNTFGNTWQQARGVLPPRTAKIAVQMDF